MIELTVKTLDSQNHQFSVEDDITVEQFKTKIADTVNVPADTQRIIYCGRVLQDSSKLADYDLNGKVVHLVQRAPPSSNPRPNNRSSPQPQRRGFRGFRGLDQGNAMYLGSMAFPANLMDTQGIIPPPPTYSLSGSRLNVARRMLRRAEIAIQLLENPSARNVDQINPDENQDEEEVTPVIEARVIVPNSVEPIDQVLNAVQDSLFNATTNNIPVVGLAGQSSGISQGATTSAPRSSSQSENSTPGGTTPRSSSSENLNSESRPENPMSLPESATRTLEMASLLTMLGQLQTRFAPFLTQYHNFMRDDPEVAVENHRQTQTMLNGVSEVFHYLGHAYHSLSDVIIGVGTPPPRPLLCRPILIQHSAVVQTGIPIQVEAQINLSADRPPPNTSQNASVETSTSAPTTSVPSTTATSTSEGGGATASLQPGFIGLPNLPTGASMRVLSFPVEVRAMRSAAAAARPQNNSANTNTASSAAENLSSSTANAAPAPPSAASSETPTPGNADGAASNNPNVEFFMEVTPEGITIDSMETTLVGSNQANDLLRGAMNIPPPEFLYSLMQMAGHWINRNMTQLTSGTTTPSTSDPAGSAQTASASAGAAQSQNAQPAAGSAGRTSTARGDTQTNPTTATHTRVTPRPHVHLAQRAMQGGFDPFLPCNSHHIVRRRIIHHVHPANVAGAQANSSSSDGQQANARGAATTSQEAGAGNTARITSILNSLGMVNRHMRRSQNPSGAPEEAVPNASAGDGIGDIPNLASIASLFADFQGAGNVPDFIRQWPTLDQLLQDDQYVPGSSIITDLIMLLSRNLTFVDLFMLNSGNLEPINRNVDDLQNFFRTRICDGDVTTAGIDRGVERLITEMQPFLQSFSEMTVRGNIDMVRSAEQLFRQRLPNIVSIAVNLNPNNLRLWLNQCLTTSKQLLALIAMASSEGDEGVEHILTQFMNRFMQQDIPQDILNWTLRTGRVHIRNILSNLSIPDSILQPYIVHQRVVVESRDNESRSNEVSSNDVVASAPIQLVETMEVDDQELDSEITAPAEESESLPNVVLGSEPWHGQVPEDWVPIIARDTQRQRRQNSQGPFSDAYLSGMPSKRRKIVNSSKPQGSLPQVIADGVRQAVSTTGLASVAPLETVAQAAGNSTEIQTAYRNLLRSTVQPSLRENEDFIPERYPNIQNYFNNGTQ